MHELILKAETIELIQNLDIKISETQNKYYDEIRNLMREPKIFHGEDWSVCITPKMDNNKINCWSINIAGSEMKFFEKFGFKLQNIIYETKTMLQYHKALNDNFDYSEIDRLEDDIFKYKTEFTKQRKAACNISDLVFIEGEIFGLSGFYTVNKVGIPQYHYNFEISGYNKARLVSGNLNGLDDTYKALLKVNEAISNANKRLIAIEQIKEFEKTHGDKMTNPWKFSTKTDLKEFLISNGKNIGSYVYHDRRSFLDLEESRELAYSFSLYVDDNFNKIEVNTTGAISNRTYTFYIQEENMES